MDDIALETLIARPRVYSTVVDDAPVLHKKEPYEGIGSTSSNIWYCRTRLRENFLLLLNGAMEG
jgi:hypothetical protein